MPRQTGKSSPNSGEEESYRRFVDAAGAAVCQTDESGLLLAVNERFCELLKRSREDLLGKVKLQHLMHPDDRDKDLGFAAESQRRHQAFGDELRYLSGEELLWAAVFGNWSSDPDSGAHSLYLASIDVTHRKKSELALRQSEARLAAIFDHAPVGLSEISLDGRFQRVNDALCNMLGRSREGLLQLSIAEVTHPEDLPHSQEVLAALAADGKPRSLDKRYRRSDGELVYANSALSLLEDAEGRPDMVLAVTVDLTERHHYQSELAADLEANQRLQEISTKLIPQDEGRTLFEELTGVVGEASGALCATLQLFDEESSELKLLASWQLSEELRKVCDQPKAKLGTVGGDVIRDKRRVIADFEGDARYVGSRQARDYIQHGVRAMQTTPLISRSGRLMGLLSTYYKHSQQVDERQLQLLDIVGRQAADLIERQQAERALKDSEQRYRMLFNSIHEGFSIMEILFDEEDSPVDYRYLQVNPAFERHSGLRAVEGRCRSEFRPAPDPRWLKTLGRVVRSGRSTHFVDEALETRRWFEVHAFRFGEPADHQVAAVFSDVTERIHEQTALREADRRKNEFLAVLAHELRNPMAPIRTGLQVLAMAPDMRDDGKQLLVLMERQMQQLVRLVDDLLDLSRITQGKIHVQIAPVALKSIIDSAVESSASLIEASGAKLHMSLPAQLPEVNVDAARMAQVFSNLLNNAAKYSDPGGEIWFELQVLGSDIQACVRDNGAGIPPSQLHKIFDAFTQVDEHLARRQGGLGLGLSLVRTLVELHGGKVEASSEGVGKGSQFTLTLPGVVCAASDRPPAGELPKRRPDPHRILVIDDNADAANALAMVLDLLGNKVERAYGGQEGIATARRFKPDVMLVDLGMPDLDGYEVARQIRAEPWARSAQLWALTGWGQQDDRRRSAEAGYDSHLVKPVDINLLRDMLSALPEATHTRH